MIEMID